MFDVIVVGGGLIGMLTARELQKRGAEVLILERGKAGGESTWAGGGILSPLYPWRYPDAVNLLSNFGHKIYPLLAAEIFGESGVDPEYTRCGMLVIDQKEASEAREWAQNWHMHLELLTRDGLRKLEPALNDQLGKAMWMPDIAQLRNPRLIKSVLGSLLYRNVNIMENTEVTGLDVKQGCIQAVCTAGKRYPANKVVIAGGAWSSGIIQAYATAPEIRPVKGQMIVFRGESDMLKSMVLSQGRYLIPRRDGRILAGSTLEYTDFDKTLTNDALHDLRNAAISLMPQLEGLVIEHHWAGLRPGSEHGVPYVCAHPDIEGLYINSGHFRNGVILGAASARLMAELITGEEPTFNPSFYSFDAVH